MGDNNEQEAADLAAMNDDEDDNLLEVTYRGDRLVNIPNVPFRLIIHASVTEIAGRACEGCHMSEVIFHNKVTKIGHYAFWGCLNLQRIELPAGLLRVERDAFWGCDSLLQIVIPASVQYIGDYAYDNCKSLHTVVFAPRTTSMELGNQMFCSCSSLQFITLPQNLRSIPAGLFYGCTSLTHLQIPESVEEIGGEAFHGSAIQAMNYSVGDDFMPGTIILPPKLRSISEKCFMNCKSVTHIRIPPSVQRIEWVALNGSDLQSIEIPDTVHRIDREACSNCSSLTEVIIHSSSNLNMADDIFAKCPALSVIKMYPWMWPTLLASMNGQPDFIIKFFRQYHTQIFDFEIVSDGGS